MNHRIVQLDGLRFVAIFMIFIAHWAQDKFSNLLLKEIPFIHGVILFFVLSGYLISHSLFVNKESIYNKLHVLKVFFIRRFLRIFPIYYITLVVILILDYEYARDLSVWLITYTINIYQSINNVNIQHLNHLWSLAVEEQFYLFWPLLVLFTKSKYLKSMIFTTIFLSIGVKFYLFYFIGNWMATSYFTLSCMFALGLGAYLAYIKLYEPKIFNYLAQTKWLFLLIGGYVIIIVFGINTRYPWYKEIFDELFFAIISTLLVLKASNNGFKSISKYFLENKIICRLGKISYGLYLFHLFVPSIFVFIGTKLGVEVNNKPLLFIIYFVITYIMAEISWAFIENPINSLKKNYKYSQNK